MHEGSHAPACRGHGPLSRRRRGGGDWLALMLGHASRRAAGVAFAALICALPRTARADHDIAYFPSFYPQEIRVESLDPEAAAREFASNTDPLHVYVGAAPRFVGVPPAHLKSVRSLKALIVATVNPESQRLQDRETRCQVLAAAATKLAPQPDIVAHRYPVTPYHADYFAHAGLVPQPNGVSSTSEPPPVFRAGPGQVLLAPDAKADAARWDLEVSEISLDALMRSAGVRFNAWPVPPWAKEGWFQAYHLLRPALGAVATRERADAIYRRLTLGDAKDLVEQANLERDLIAALLGGCERMVIGYRLVSEFYNDDFSNGVENILVDSESGFNSPVFVRAVKLKDFLWNGWLRVGIDEPAAAAWNPLGGFTDAAGRLVWSIAADNAFLPVPDNSTWIANRAEIRADAEPPPRQTFPLPQGALAVEKGTGRLAPAGEGIAATLRLRYRVLASPYWDGSDVEPADLFYPFALALRWGTDENKGTTFDPEIALATRLMRQRLRGVKAVKSEETPVRVADLTYIHRSWIIDVYLDDPAPSEQNSRLVAPPWSAMPWHVLALMEAAVERGRAAFSESEAKRRGLPWLDLVRDPAQIEMMRGLIKEFEQSGYRPAALEGLVGPEAAKARWRLLGAFLAEKGHLLVTNGPYRLKSWSPATTTFAVVREFNYPVGLGTFNQYAYPAHAIITAAEQTADRVVVSADVEFAVQEQRNRRPVRMPLRRDTLRGLLPIRTALRYLVVGADGRVAAAGPGTRLPDGRFAVALPPDLSRGRYTLHAAIVLDGNTIDPSIAAFPFEHK